MSVNWNEEMGKMHICCSIDDNYAQHCGVMLCSLFENNKQTKFEIHVLITSLNAKNTERLTSLIESYGSVCRFYAVDGTVLKGVKFRENRPLTEAAYFRILMASVLDVTISKVLYLDADILVLGDITDLFSVELDGYALAATKDLAKLTDERRFQLSMSYDEEYFCSGMMLINLDYWRANDSEPQLIEFSKRERKVFNHDQDALNAVFHGNWFMLSPRWNRFFPDVYEKSFFRNKEERREFEKNPVIIHFSNYFKPWNDIKWMGKKWKKYRNYYYHYLSLTPWPESRPKKLKMDHFGIYRFLFISSSKALFVDLGLYFDRVLNFLRRLVFLPLRLYHRFF